MSKKNQKDMASMLMACASMIGVETRGDFFDLIKYVIANEKEFFAPPTNSNKEKDK